MSSMRHESDLVLREDSLTGVTTGLVHLCKSAVKQTLGMSDEKVYDFSVSIERLRYQMVGRPGAPQLDLFTYGKENKAYTTPQVPLHFGHHWFPVARVLDHSPLPFPWWCLQCQMRWSTRRPVSNSIQLQAETWKQSAANDILNGIALDYFVKPSSSVWHVRCGIGSLGPAWHTGDGQTGHRESSQSPNQLRNWTYELPDGNILTCRQTLLMRRSVPHDTAQIDCCSEGQS